MKKAPEEKPRRIFIDSATGLVISDVEAADKGK